MPGARADRLIAGNWEKAPGGPAMSGRGRRLSSMIKPGRKAWTSGVPRPMELDAGDNQTDSKGFKALPGPVAEPGHRPAQRSREGSGPP